MIAQLAQSDGFSFDNLVQIVVVAFFFLAPAVRGILASRKQAEEDPDKPGKADPEAQRRALEKWERMMRGEDEAGRPVVVTEQEPELVPIEEPVAEPVVRQPRAEPKRLVPARPALEPASAAPESSASLPPMPEPAPLADKLSSPTRTKLAGVSGQLSAELEREGVASSAGAARSAGAQSSGSGSRDHAAGRSAKRSLRKYGRVDWRRAVVLSELLSTPLALRRETPGTGR